MAVAYDNANSGTGNTTSSVTFAITCGASANLLWVGAGSGATAPHLTSSVTYHSVGMTGEVLDAVTGHAHVSGHYLKAPDTGSLYDVVVTLTGSDDEVICGAVSYSGVDQTTPVGTPNDTGNTTGQPSVSIASAIGELVVDAMYWADWQTGKTTNSGQTSVRVNVGNSGDGYGWLGMSEKAGAASVAMTWSSDAVINWRIGGISLKPTASTTPITVNTLSVDSLAGGEIV